MAPADRDTKRATYATLQVQLRQSAWDFTDAQLLDLADMLHDVIRDRRERRNLRAKSVGGRSAFPD